MKLFEISLTNYCNFKCSYCISDSNRGADKFSAPLLLDENGNLKIHPDGMSQLEYDTLKNTAHDSGDWINLDVLYSFILDNLDDWVINLTGGEPLYYPNIDKFILKLSKTHKVIVTSNISLISSKKELLKIDRNNFFLRIGYHPEFRSEKEFIRNMSYIIDHNFKYIINYVLHPSYYVNSTKYSDHIRLLIENNYDYEVTPFEGKFDNITYPTPISKRSELEMSLLSDHQLNFTQKSPIGDSFILAEPSGVIYECQGKEVMLGSVYENTLSLIQQPKNKCFNIIGCSPVASANNYLKIFTNNTLS